MRKHILLLLFFIATIYVSLTSFISSGGDRIIQYSPITDSTKSNVCSDSFYSKTYNELYAMLHDSEPISFKRAVFITENAYEKGQLNYDSYLSGINVIAIKLKALIARRPIQFLKMGVSHIPMILMILWVIRTGQRCL